ncbi:MAG TPA: sialidase family protein, partial [Candidatus Kapabacteria bacterium]|nr:sialidase family protein [Candidatus Kapabacteria bacterium]
MTRVLRLLSIVLVVSFFAAGIHHPLPQTTHPTPASHSAFSESASEGGKDNPEGRDQWEWMRLHDPATGVIPANIRNKELAFAATIPARAQHSTFFKTLNGATTQSYNWQPRGPFNVGGRTRALGVDIQNENVILAGGITGGMWRSTDAGTTWVRTTRLDQLPSVTCLAQDTRTGHENTWYYGTGEFRTNVRRFGDADYYGDGIFKSTDDGITWHQLPSTATSSSASFVGNFQYVTNVITDPSNTTQDVVYAATYGEIVRSSDGGTTWTTVLGDSANSVGFTNVAIGSDGSVYAGMGSGGTTHGIWRSPDGMHWTDITPTSLWSDSTRGMALDVSPSDPTTLYVLAETPYKGLGVPSSYVDSEWYSLWKYTYKNGNGSNGTWTNYSANIPYYGNNNQGYNNYENYNGLGSYALVVKIAPYDPNTVLLGGTDMYISTDGFSTKSHITWLGGYDTYGNYGANATDLHPDQHALVFSYSQQGTVYASNDGGVFTIPDVSAGSSKWTPLDNGYITGQFYTTAIDHSGADRTAVVGGLQDNGSWNTDSTNASTPWYGIGGGDGSFCAIGDSANSYYTSSQYGSIVGFINTNGTWNAYQVMQAQQVCDLFVNPFVLDPVNDHIMYLPGRSNVWRNNAVNTSGTLNNWFEMTNTKTPDNSDVTAVGISTANPAHRMYYGTSTGRLFVMNGADQGNPSPTEITGTDFPQGGFTNCVAVDPFDGSRAMVVFSNYNVQSLFYTSDAGTTWNAVGGNLEQNPDGTGDGPSCRWATILHRGSDTLYLVGTSTGLYSTTTLDNFSEANPSVTWVQEGATSIGNVIVDMVDARQSDGYITVATWGNGMFSTFIPTIIRDAVSEPAGSAPQSAQLDQNYP